MAAAAAAARSASRSRPCKTKSAVVYTAAVPAPDNKRSRGVRRRRPHIIKFTNLRAKLNKYKNKTLEDS